MHPDARLLCPVVINCCHHRSNKHSNSAARKSRNHNHGRDYQRIMYISAQWSFSDDSLELMLVYSLTRPSSELFCHVTFFATFMAFWSYMNRAVMAHDFVLYYFYWRAFTVQPNSDFGGSKQLWTLISNKIPWFCWFFYQDFLAALQYTLTIPHTNTGSRHTS